MGLVVMLTAWQFLMGGCATIWRGTDQQITFTSDPGGAEVQSADGLMRFSTPTVAKLSKKSGHTFLVSKPGYHTERVEITRQLGQAWLGNALAGGIIGVGVDFNTGASHFLTPESVHVALVPVRAGETPQVRTWSPPAAAPAATATSSTSKTQSTPSAGESTPVDPRRVSGRN
jgi:hypothetical protein